ncbi:MAG TPA: type II toxin-antitoxin system VapC family toxin [Casimicrobiaceae bacterium]
MAFVLDASVAIAWVVASQATPYTRRIRLRAKREPLHVPAIFSVEVANVLVVLERRGILTEGGSEAAAEALGRLNPIVHQVELGIPQLRAVARRFGLSAYDATYLALALELRLPIACGDRPLKAALRAAGVKLA